MPEPMDEIAGGPGVDILSGGDLMDDLTAQVFQEGLGWGSWPIRANRLTPAQIMAVRAHSRASVAEFADILNVSQETIVAWERGSLYPDGAAQFLLTILFRKGLPAFLEFLSDSDLCQDKGI